MPSTSSALSAKLIFPTKEIVEEFYLPIIYTACRTCYSEQLPDQIWDKAVSRTVADEKQQNLVRKVMESGHGSTIEHVNFTFAISGVTRTLSHQLVRHRAGTAFDQQSQRYVSFKQRDNYTVPDSIANGDLPDDLAGRFERAVDENLDLYGQLLQAEVPAEDARFIFPNAMQTNLIMTVNLRQLIHMSGLRLCTMAQWEIRQLFKQIRHEVFRVSPFFGSFLVPKCVPLGYCDEMGNRDEHCRIKPHRDTVMAVWEAYRGGGLEETDGPVVPDTSPVPPEAAAGPAAGGRRRRPTDARRPDRRGRRDRPGGNLGPGLTPRSYQSGVTPSPRVNRRSSSAHASARRRASFTRNVLILVESMTSSVWPRSLRSRTIRSSPWKLIPQFAWS